ncbi:unnamed protein product [Closterium sp. Yama58-4]|nr:unnamed protein product [Closterium sp. Yama58-4]
MAILASLLVTAVARISRYDSMLAMPGGEGREAFRQFLKRGSKTHKTSVTKDSEPQQEGTRWALLIAGSAGYGNYRHQADVCHAYQLLRRNGNPHPGTIINRPDGPDVYHGVPKDYTGRHVTVNNFIAALLGNASAINPLPAFPCSIPLPHPTSSSHFLIPLPHPTSSSHFLIPLPHPTSSSHFLIPLPHPTSSSSHFLLIPLPHPSSPSSSHFLHPTSSSHFLIPLPHPTSSSHFLIPLPHPTSSSHFLIPLPHPTSSSTSALLPTSQDYNGAARDSMPEPPFLMADEVVGEYDSLDTAAEEAPHKGFKELVFYLEASSPGWRTVMPTTSHETLRQQYHLVKERTSNHGTYDAGSHVMLYGEKALGTDPVSDFLGDASLAPEAGANSEDAYNEDAGMTPWRMFAAGEAVGVVGQRDAEVLHLWHKYKNAPEDSPRKQAAMAALSETFTHRRHVDQSVRATVAAAVGEGRVQAVLEGRQAEGRALVDDWMCLREMVRAYEASCGRITQYGMKHMRAFANLCNAAVPVHTVAAAAQEACPSAANAVPPGLLVAPGGGFSV